jgi:hypothetical protein
MKANRFFFPENQSRYIGTALLLILLAIAVILCPQNAAAQQTTVPKLTLSQVEQLVSHGVPDTSLSAQIQKRGLAFTPTQAIIDSLRDKGAGPQTLADLRAEMTRISLQPRHKTEQEARGKPKPVEGATLLVLCDLPCDWKLDGEAKGHIDPDGSARAKVELGQHIVIAATEDGADQVKLLSDVKSSGQTAVNIELKPVRDARLKAEQQARDEAEQEARDKAARVQQEKDRQERERAAREEAARPTWTEPATGLMWTKKDNGYDVDWQQATNYCRNLQLAGYSGWRLPTIDELLGIYDSNISYPGVAYVGYGESHVAWHVKGNLSLSGWHWSSTEKATTGDPWHFGLYFAAKRIPTAMYNNNTGARALCVR